MLCLSGYHSSVMRKVLGANPTQNSNWKLSLFVQPAANTYLTLFRTEEGWEEMEMGTTFYMLSRDTVCLYNSHRTTQSCFSFTSLTKVCFPKSDLWYWDGQGCCALLWYAIFWHNKCAIFSVNSRRDKYQTIHILCAQEFEMVVGFDIGTCIVHNQRWSIVKT